MRKLGWMLIVTSVVGVFLVLPGFIDGLSLSSRIGEVGWFLIITLAGLFLSGACFVLWPRK